jgi:hypothetical protein
MSNHAHPLDFFVLENPVRVARLRVEVVGRDRLRRAAVADLIGDDDAKPFLHQRVDERLEIESAKVVAVQDQHGSPVWLPLRGHIHVGDAHRLRVDADVEILRRIGIRTFVTRQATRLDVGRRWHRWQHGTGLRQRVPSGKQHHCCGHGV